MSIEDVNSYILDTMVNQYNQKDLSLTDELQLSSIQILKIVSSIEKKFGIEVEDEYIFHGLFTSCEVLCSYICDQLELSEDQMWRTKIDVKKK